jgi:hypothetical protein
MFCSVYLQWQPSAMLLSYSCRRFFAGFSLVLHKDYYYQNYVLSSFLDFPGIIFEPMFFLTKQKEGKCFTWVHVLLWFVQGRVYVLQTASPSYFRVVQDSLQDFLGFSVKIFATKICLVSASLVKCEDLSGSWRRLLLPNPVLSCLVAFPGINLECCFLRINKNKENALCSDQVNTTLPFRSSIIHNVAFYLLLPCISTCIVTFAY